MSAFQAKHEGPTVGSDYGPAVSLLDRKPPKNNIVIGDDDAQIGFLKLVLGVAPVLVEYVNDDMLIGQENRFYQVISVGAIANVSPEMKDKSRTGIWTADPILKGSVAINMIVRYAHKMLFPTGKNTVKLDRATLDLIGDQVVAAKILNIRGALWLAAWLLTAPAVKTPVWLQPWDHATKWLPPGTDPAFRLNTLHQTLTNYGNFLEGKEAAISHLSASVKKKIKELSLDKQKVVRTIRVIGVWRMTQTDPYVCAMHVSAIWA